MTKLNQIVAVVKGTKEATNKATAPLFQLSGAVFSGLSQTYRPRDEENGIQYPADSKTVQTTVLEVIENFRRPTSRLLDVISAAENTNTNARGDIVVDGQTIASDVPVTFLMQLEKYLEREFRGLINKFPTLDPAETWDVSNSQRAGVYESKPRETAKTRKVPTVITLAPATDKHAAQAQLVNVDEVEGYWEKKLFSGAITATDKADYLERIEKLIAAVKKAREQANDIEVVDKPIGDALLNYVFGSPRASKADKAS